MMFIYLRNIFEIYLAVEWLYQVNEVGKGLKSGCIRWPGDIRIQLSYLSIIWKVVECSKCSYWLNYQKKKKLEKVHMKII